MAGRARRPFIILRAHFVNGRSTRPAIPDTVEVGIQSEPRSAVGLLVVSAVRVLGTPEYLGRALPDGGPAAASEPRLCPKWRSGPFGTRDLRTRTTLGRRARSAISDQAKRGRTEESTWRPSPRPPRLGGSSTSPLRQSRKELRADLEGPSCR